MCYQYMQSRTGAVQLAGWQGHTQQPQTGGAASLAPPPDQLPGKHGTMNKYLMWFNATFIRLCHHTLAPAGYLLQHLAATEQVKTRRLGLVQAIVVAY